MSKACFDPREAAQYVLSLLVFRLHPMRLANAYFMANTNCYDRMWVRMERAERGTDTDSVGGITAWIRALFQGGSVGNVDFLSTHPASGKRIKVRAVHLVLI